MTQRIDKAWEYVGCNLCKSNNSEVIFDSATSWLNRGTYSIVRCADCGLVYLNPRPKKESIQKYYDPEHYWGEDIIEYKQQINEDRDKAYGYLYKIIFHLMENGSIFDIGAGTGLFLTKFNELGWKIRGVELSKDACKYASKVYGINLDQGDINDSEHKSNTFDIVNLSNTLEHLYDPYKTLQRVHQVLNKGGYIIVTVPNFYSLARIIFGMNWYALQPPTHLYHFTPKTIKQMLAQAGFNNITIKHNYRQHNLYIFFESLRLAFSPRFQGKLKTHFTLKTDVKTPESLSYKLKKAFAMVISYIIAFIEPLIGHGEVITVYATKS